MKILYKIIFLFFILFTSSILFADVNIYLYPIAHIKGNGITLNDIAMVETNGENAENLENIRIDSSFYADGIVDRKELLDIIRNFSNEMIFINGSGSRIVQHEKSDNDYISYLDSRLIEKGNSVNFEFSKNGIKIEIPGTALEDGGKGDQIKVKLTNSKILKGTVVNYKTVRLDR